MRLCFFFLCLFKVPVVWADIIYVNPGGLDQVKDGTSWPRGYPSLQNALATANPGDQIYVAAGTYHPDDFGGFTNTNNRENTFSLADQVEVYGGFPSPQGGTFSQRDPEVYRCFLSGDLTQDDFPDPDFSDNSLHVVTVEGDVTKALLDGFTITGGNADLSSGNGGRGAGLLSVDGGQAVIRNCFFEKNHADEAGGAVYISEGSITLERCRFEQNSSDGSGGAVHVTGDDPVILRACSFRANTADSGGAVCAEETLLTLRDCDFTGNYSTRAGGALANLAGADSSLINCTFQGNASAGDGGAIFNLDSSPFIRSCIIWGNASRGQTGRSGSAIGDEGSSRPSFFHSLVEGFDGKNSGSGNLDGTDAANAPHFLSPVLPLSAPTLRGDSRLMPWSEAINSGSNLIAGSTDIAGNARIADGTADMGAFEGQGYLYVRQAGSGGNDSGDSWSNAFFELQQALDAASSGTMILAAGGSYLPAVNAAATTTSTFSIPSGVILVGGFPDEGGDERDPSLHETILSGEIRSGTGSVRHIVTFSETDLFTRMDGFTIGQRMETPHNLPRSGGLRATRSQGVVANCRFQKNDVNTLNGNGSTQSGGATLLSRSSLRFYSSHFLANGASSGGAVSLVNAEGRFEGCSFRGNTIRSTAESVGGALAVDQSVLRLRNCLFSGNTTPARRAARSIYARFSQLEADHCSFFEPVTGAGRNSNIFASRFRATNCINSNIIRFEPTGQAGEADTSTVERVNDVTVSRNEVIWSSAAWLGDYRLLPGSDAADSAEPGFLRGLDLAGRVFPTSATHAAGAFQTRRRYVRAMASGENDGSSWLDAHPFLADALAEAEPGEVILVAAGTYHPDEGSGLIDNDREASFVVPSGVAVLGGFPLNGGSLSAPATHETILSGEIDQDGVFTANSHHVVTSSGGDPDHTLLRGFTIQDGNAGSSGPLANRGGGLLARESSRLRVADCRLLNNVAVGRGGAVFTQDARPLFINCLFLGNGAGQKGGAVSTENQEDEDLEAPIFLSCVFQSNAAAEDGGAMANRFTRPLLLSCAFSGNRADANGGGIYNYSARPWLENVTLQGNWAESGSGGGIANAFFSRPTLYNCIVYGNAAEMNSEMQVASISDENSPLGTYFTSLISGFTEGELNNSGDGGSGNFTTVSVNGNPIGEHPDFVDAGSPFSATTAGGDIRLATGSFGVGTGAEPVTRWPFDAAGEERIQSTSPTGAAVIDLGAYEGEFEAVVDSDLSFPALFPDLSATEDENGNGLTNFEDYASGADPTTPGDPAFSPVFDQASGELRFRYRTGATDFQVVREKSSSLTGNSWVPLVEGSDYSTVSSGTVHLATSEVIRITSPEPKLFFRVRYAAP